ncbi:hypothetical protein CBR_g18858 [Chara braunii]|uniref:Uncharacterized protein n=1 Tax=Chara braunii TaxID=69332 RepID=A0A388KWK6_CHABU|nr:hypothetical protein CBR_g18858 [Chara braunii]|eukprot:GBG74446.1 hypothetical protein CBR_g18858 [Chara braunii]
MGEAGKLSNQFDVLKKVKAEELSEYTAFKYAKKKRAREQGVKDRDRTAPESKDDFQDLRPKKWRSGQNQKKKNPNMSQTDSEEESARTQLEKEAAVVIAQTEKLNKLNEEYSAEFTTITHIARDQAPLVVETAKSSRLTLMNIRPLIAARYVEKLEEWQSATNVSFQIPCFEEGQNVATTLREKISTEYPLGVCDSMPSIPDQEDALPQPEHEGSTSQHKEHGRHSPQAFSPLIVKLSNKANLSSRMRWRPWRTIKVVPYSVLAGSSLPVELASVSLAQLVTTGMLEGDGDLDARAYPVDWERFYRSDESEGEDQEWHSDDEKEEDD